MLCVFFLHAQNASNAACALSGRDTVVAGSTATFTLSPCSAANWNVSCGTVTAQNANSVTVNFSDASCSTITVAASGGTAVGVKKTISIAAAPPMLPGNIVATTQIIGYKHIPSILQAGPAMGGLCDGNYIYQWFSSTDSISFSPIADATGQSYQPGPMTSTTWFKRQATCSLSGTVFSNPIKMTVAPALPTTILQPSWQAINYPTLPAALSFAPPSNPETIQFFWQASVNPNFSGATIISGANSSSFSPGPLNTSTYYRVILVSGGDSLYSSPAVVAVYPPLSPGSLTPVSQTIANDSLPELLTCVGTTGGSGPYSYQWYSSPDGTNWNPIPGVISAGFNPGTLSATTYFRVLVISDGSMAYSSTALINVTPQQ